MSDLLSVVGATLGAFSFVLSVLSFHRSGALIRVRAWYCDGQLGLAVVNAGRTPDSVVHISLGGADVNQGFDLSLQVSAHLDRPMGASAPFIVETPKPLIAQVGLDGVIDPRLQARIEAGFESVHFSLGSLSAVGADIIPVQKLRQSAAWSPRSRISRARRFGPLIGAGVATLAMQAGPNALDAWHAALALMLLLVVPLAYAWTGPRRETYLRARLERQATLLLLAMAGFSAGTQHDLTGRNSSAIGWVAPAILSVGIVFAWPTAVATGWAGMNMITNRLRAGLRRPTRSGEQ